MCKTKDDLINKINSQIEDKLEQFGEPTIHEFEDGSAIVNYFDSWEDFISDTKTKEVKKIGDFSNNKNVLMIFAKKGTVVPITDFECSKTYVFFTGKIRLFFDDREDVIVEGLSTMECDIPHGGEVFEDSYFIVVDEY